MSTAAVLNHPATDPDEEDETEVDHLYCCDENVGLCGVDLTGMTECPTDCPAHVECRLCNYVRDNSLPCTRRGCPGWPA